MGQTNPEPVTSIASEPNQRAWWASWQFAAWLSAAFCFFVGLLLVVSFAVASREDPLHSMELKELRQKLQTSPTDDYLKQRIRHLDLDLREKYFQHLSAMRFGTYLLLGSAGAFLVAAARAYRFERQLPEGTFESNRRTLAGKARCSVMITGAAVAILLLVLSLSRARTIPDRPEDIDRLLANKDGKAIALPDFASTSEMADNWPRFLGPYGSGYSSNATPPASWDTKSGEGVAWKTLVPLPGYNSPIVWNERVFLSGGNADERSVICFNAKTGQELWRKVVGKNTLESAKPDSPENSLATGYAASTMATDGKRLFVMFSSGDLAALDFSGELLWSKCLGPLKNIYGHASSLLTWKDKLFAQVDQGEAAQGKSRLYAFNCQNGQVFWQQPRNVGSSWSSPALIEGNGKMQVIAIAVPRISGYSVDTGAELWRVEGVEGEVTSSAVTGAGLVFAVSPGAKLFAIRPDGQGDVTKSHVAWSSDDNVPDVTCPATDGELLFTMTTSGILTCYDARTGKKQWEHDYETEFNASPAIAGKSLYIFSMKGHAFVIEAARQFKEIFRTEMPDTFSASPAFVHDHIYLRGATNLWCIGPLRGQIAH
jgi:outer membrane protein assembly factor BamB